MSTVIHVINEGNKMKICQEFILRNAPTVKKECGPGTRFWSDLKL